MIYLWLVPFLEFGYHSYKHEEVYERGGVSSNTASLSITFDTRVTGMICSTDFSPAYTNFN